MIIYGNFISQVELLTFGILIPNTYSHHVIHAESVNSFKTRLNKFWNNQDREPEAEVKFKYRPIV